jgi:hypothetical protein
MAAVEKLSRVVVYFKDMVCCGGFSNRLVYGVAVVRAIFDAPCDIEQFAGLLTVLRSAAAREAILLASERPDLPNAPTLLAITYSSAS